MPKSGSLVVHAESNFYLHLRGLSVVKMEDFNDMPLIKTKHKSLVYFYVIILLFLVFPLKSFGVSVYSQLNTGTNFTTESGYLGYYPASFFPVSGVGTTFYTTTGNETTVQFRITDGNSCYEVASSSANITFIKSNGVPVGGFSNPQDLGAGVCQFDVSWSAGLNLNAFYFSNQHQIGDGYVTLAGSDLNSGVTQTEHEFPQNLIGFGGPSFQICTDSSCTSFPIEGQYASQFVTESYVEWIQPTNNQIVASSFFDIEVDLFVADSEELLFGSFPHNFSLVAEFQSYAEAPDIDNVYSLVLDDNIDPTLISGSIETYFASSTILSVDGFHLAVVKFVPNPYEILTGSYMLSDTISININSTSTDFYEVISTSAICDGYTFPVNGICRVLVRTFLPTISFGTYLKQLSETMRQKIPFGYFYQIYDIQKRVSEVDDSIGSDIVIVNPLFGSITFFDWSVLATQFDDWFGDIFVYFEYLVWAGFISYLVFRFMHITL